MAAAHLGCAQWDQSLPLGMGVQRAGTKPVGQLPFHGLLFKLQVCYTHCALHIQIPVWLFLIPLRYVHVAGLWTLHAADRLLH